MKDWQTVMEFCDSTGILPIMPLNCTELVFFLPTLRNLASVLERLHYLNLFRKMSRIQNLSREMAMEYLRNSHGKVMGKSKVCRCSVLV